MALVLNRRKESTDETILRWMNIVSAIAAAGPMLLTEIKPLLPEHYFGVLSAVFFTLNAGLLVYRRFQADKIIEVHDPGAPQTTITRTP